MTETTMIAYAGSFVSLAAFVGALVRSAELKKALQGGLVFLAVFVFLTVSLHSGVTLTLAEQTLLWTLPGLAAWDYMERAIPVPVVVPLFVFAALLHTVLYSPWMPLFALGLIVVPLALPFWLDRFAVGDRIVVAWLVYAVGVLGLIATAVALLTSMGRKNVPFVTHLAFATSILLVPFAYWGAHVGRFAWRF